MSTKHMDWNIDPVTLEVLWSRLRDIPEEMGTHLQRTAFSPVIKYGEDFSTGLFTWDGRLISQGVYTAGHLGSMPIAMQKILDEHFGLDDWEPGDLVVTNDPYINSGHLPDFFTFEPVFYQNDLVGFCVTTGHQTDIGGAAAGSYTMEIKDMYGEGLQLPPTKIYSGGEPREDIIDIILENSRVPDQLRGDLRAHRGASRVGKELYHNTVAEHGFETFKEYVDEIIDRTEQTAKAAIEKAPDGVQSFTEKLDGFEEPLEVEATITIDGDEMVVDFAGTADQQPHYAINCSWNYTFAFTVLAVKAAFDPDTPPTQGMIEPITMKAPEQSLVNPQPPVPVGSRQLLSDFVLSAVNGALSSFVPEQVPAAGSQLYWQVMEFTDPASGQQSILQDGFYGGAGAAVNHDGAPAAAGTTNVKNTPVEAIENDFPVRVRTYGLVSDTGGSGTYQGGNGTVREYEFLQETTVQCVNERFKFGAHGVHGGADGSPGSGILNPDSDNPREIASKEQFIADSGDVFRIYTPGGGGYGDPEERKAERVRDDIKEGLISKEQARSEYGVEVSDK